jgi:hypothetical protein
MITPPPGRILATAIGVDPGPTRSAFAHLAAIASETPAGVAVTIWPLALWYDTHDRPRLRNALLRLRASASAPAGLLGIESIAGPEYNPARSRDLRQTARIEQWVRDVADFGMGEPVDRIDLPAGFVREKLFGHRGASDPQIRLGLEGLYTSATGAPPGDELPPMRADDRAHLLDALAAAYVLLALRLAGPAFILTQHERAAYRCDDPWIDLRTFLDTPVPAGIAKAFADRLRLPGGLLPPRVRAQVALLRDQERGARKVKKQAKAAGVKLPRAARRSPPKAVREAGEAKRAATRAKRRIARL